MVDIVLFAAFPYVAVILAVVVAIYRYNTDRYSYSSFSSQFLENRTLFWGSVPWHFGILIILLAHLLAVLMPGVWANLISDPSRLYVLEVIGLALALAATAALALLIIRRLFNRRVFVVSSTMDWVLLLVLVSQMALGFWVALFFRWGSDWYLHTAVPWLQSLAQLDPETQFVTSLPWVVKLHMLGGFVIIALFPFTRLVHLVTFPITYLWRPYQVVIWNRRRTET
ncbi:MAG: respiratory nitrate reductase subunit gamma [Vicinamibacterales bacterium]|jgi:nitrate reductase gamma subunit|nr:respiratory nitrate reductase subunit gamma [Vicinamibacterales bacterium]